MAGVVQSNTTVGGGGQLLLGLLSQPGPMLTMRGGRRFDALFGSETPEGDMAESLSSRNFQLMLEFAITFRS